MQCLRRCRYPYPLRMGSKRWAALAGQSEDRNSWSLERTPGWWRTRRSGPRLHWDTCRARSRHKADSWGTSTAPDKWTASGTSAGSDTTARSADPPSDTSPAWGRSPTVPDTRSDRDTSTAWNSPALPSGQDTSAPDSPAARPSRTDRWWWDRPWSDTQ